MTWIRANIKQGAQLALFAFALQILMSFGHFHGINAPSDHAPLRSQPLVNPDSSGRVLSLIPDPASAKPLPASNRDPDRLPYGECAICAVMAMAHALVVAAAPVLLLPRALEFVYRAVGAGAIDASSARVAFQPRAPPVS